jgi:hypothetical protein
MRETALEQKPGLSQTVAGVTGLPARELARGILAVLLLACVVAFWAGTVSFREGYLLEGSAVVNLYGLSTGSREEVDAALGEVGRAIGLRSVSPLPRTSEFEHLAAEVFARRGLRLYLPLATFERGSW